MKNLTRLYEKSSKQIDWYYKAHEFAKGLSLKHGIPLANVVGIISALSPSCRWEANKLQAEALIKGQHFGFTTYGSGVEKAIRLLSHDEPSAEFNEKTGAKTYNFYYNILQPDDPRYITIDRHAYYLATGQIYLGIHYALYKKVADHYKLHAKRNKLLPNQLQAALWVNHTEPSTITCPF